MNNYLEMQFLEQYATEHQRILTELLADNPGLGITAYVMAGDLAIAAQMTAMARAGKLSAVDAAWRVGSFARLDWAIEHCPDAWVIENLPALWRDSDPDDTKPEYLALWRRAFITNGGRIICDGEPLAERRLELFRGQMRGEPLGLSWTTNRDTATSFAEGAGVRRPITNGIVYRAVVSRRFALAYLTGRNEDEVVLDIEAANIGRIARECD